MEHAMEMRPGVPQNGGNGLVFDRLRSKWDPVHREGSGVPQNEGNGLCWSATVETGVLFIRRGVAYRKTGLHGILFISTVDLLQPPRAPVHPASTARYSTGSCSTTPPRAPLHRLLFIQPSTTPRGPVHPEATPPLTVHPSPPPPQRSLFIQRGSNHRLQLAAVAKESLDWVQLTTIDRSLGFGNV